MHYDGYLCIFSDGNNDFYVNEGSNNISTKGQSYLGTSYELPQGIVYGSEQAKSYFAGS